MSSTCPIKQILAEKVDPNDVPVNALHASSVRLMTHFLRAPSPDLAQAVIRILNVLASHEESFRPESGADVYQQIIASWECMLLEMTASQSNRSEYPHLH